MTPPIPQDIVDIVIDFLHDDKQSLMDCRRMCRSWTYSTHTHLFKSIRVERRRSEVAFTLVNLRTFLRRTPVIRPFVRKLHVGSLNQHSNIKINAPLLHSVTSLLVSLDTLVLQGMNLVGVDEPSLADYLYAQPVSPVPIKKLVLTSVASYIDADSPQALVALLSLFSRIDELRCRTVFWPAPPSPEDDASPSIATAIDSLIIQNCPWLASTLFNLLIRSDSAQHLSHLSWDPVDCLEWPSYHLLIQKAQSLKSLTYDLPTGSRISVISRRLSDPSSYCNLQSIHFRFCSNGEAHGLFDLVYRVLSYYSTPASLQQLHYEICINRYSIDGIQTLSQHRWDLLEQLIERRYLRLELLAFKLSSTDDLNSVDDAIEILHARLPILLARGVLVIERGKLFIS